VQVADWDEVEAVHVAKGEMDVTVQRLGDAAGTVGVGVNRIRIAPDKLSTPPHSHGASEEIFFVLAGSGLAWQDEEVHEIRAGDCIVYRANELEHTLRAGDEGLDVLVYGTRIPTELGWLPRSRAVRFGWPWVEGRTDDPWDIEAQQAPLEFGEPSERPSNIVNVDDVEGEEWTHKRGDAAGTTKHLGRAAGSVRTGLNLDLVAEGKLNTSPHCHSAEEEVFVVLDGEGTLLLGEDEEPVRAGHVLARPPGTRIAHAFRGGPPGLSVLCYGTRVPNDITYYPRSGIVALRGVGVFGRFEPVDPNEIY
jgi:uncharacterized cupin superfamily protein